MRIKKLLTLSMAFCWATMNAQTPLGISPADFIRNVQLKRAAQLLTDNPTLSINEVSIRVGFSTPRNFSTQFKKMFGVLPSEYRGAENH